jgi:DNA-binding PucR family transcriptional regulator
MGTKKDEEKNDEAAGSEEESVNPERGIEAMEREKKAREETIIKLEQNLAERDSEIAGLTQALDEARKANDELGQALTRAVAAYKEMVVKANPGLLPEMISGDTIDEIDESVKKARAVMERVRQEIEAEAARTKIPAGAPPRSPLDLSGLSAREKIQYAIRGSSS